MENTANTPNKKSPSRLAQLFTKTAADFENSKIQSERFAKKFALYIAAGAFGFAIISNITTMVIVFYHKDPTPQVLEVDKSTGSVNLLRPLDDTKVQYNEAVDKYWLANYVRQREGYDWYTIQEAYDAVQLMSAPDIATEYAKGIQTPESPLNLCKDKCKVVIKISSVTFVENIAQVRYTSQKVSMTGENNDQSPVQNYIATIAYKYDSAWMTDQQRLINATGFKALSYRRDAEVTK